MLKKIFLLYLFLVSTLFADVSNIPSEILETLDQDVTIEYPKIERITLKNNIDLYILKNNLLPKTNISVYFEGGEVEESNSIRGITSIWGTSLIESGSHKYPIEKLASILDSQAIQISFEHSLERSSFNINALSSNVENALIILLEIFNNPNFNPENIETIKKKALLSLKHQHEIPSSLARAAMQYIFWKNNIRGELVTTDSINNITLANIEAWHKRLWSTKRISIAISGDFNLENIKSILENNIQINNPTDLNLDNILDISGYNNPQLAQSYYLIEQKTTQAAIIWQAPSVKHLSNEYYAIKVFDFLLGADSFNSILMQEVRVKSGLTYGISSNLKSNKNSGTISIVAQTQNKNIDSVINMVEQILSKPELFVTEASVEKAKKALKNKFIFLNSNPHTYLQLQLSLIWDGLKSDYLSHFIVNITNTNVNDIIKVAQKYYNPSNFTTVIVAPQDINIKTKQKL